MDTCRIQSLFETLLFWTWPSTDQDRRPLTSGDHREPVNGCGQKLVLIQESCFLGPWTPLAHWLGWQRCSWDHTAEFFLCLPQGHLWLVRQGCWGYDHHFQTLQWQIEFLLNTGGPLNGSLSIQFALRGHWGGGWVQQWRSSQNLWKRDGNHCGVLQGRLFFFSFPDWNIALKHWQAYRSKMKNKSHKNPGGP